MHRAASIIDVLAMEGLNSRHPLMTARVVVFCACNHCSVIFPSFVLGVFHNVISVV